MSGFCEPSNMKGKCNSETRDAKRKDNKKKASKSHEAVLFACQRIVIKSKMIVLHYSKWKNLEQDV